MWTEETVEIQQIEQLLLQGFDVEIDSPSGYVPVSAFVEKGSWPAYECAGPDSTVVVNENHLFMTDSGWQLTKDITSARILMNDGTYHECTVKPLNEVRRIVDIQVDHPEHWYYANGFTSHNTHVGKSLGLCHLAGGYLNSGMNVLYITFEMAEEEIRKRIDANLLNVKMDDIGPGMNREAFIKRVAGIASKTRGRLKIKEYPTSGASTANIRHYLQELKLKHNFIPDVILVDYLNIVASDRHKSADNSYAYKQSVAEELRGLAKEVNADDPDPIRRGCVMWSALQLNRSGLKSSDPDMTDTADSIGIAFTADFTLLLYTNPELIKAGMLMCKQEKNRYKNLNYRKRFALGVDYDKMRWFPVEDSVQPVPNIDEDDDNSVPNPRGKAGKFKDFH